MTSHDSSRTGSLAEVPDEPLLLAVESSTRWLGVALLRGSTPIGACREEGPSSGAERVLPLIDALLTEHGISIPEIVAFAVSAGPGSFTGLRVGIATVKGLAFGRGAVVAPVSTLDALLHGAACDDGIVVAALDAHRGELYACARRFTPGREPEELVAPQVIEPAALGRRLAASSSPAALEGGAASSPTALAGGVASSRAAPPSDTRLTWMGDIPEAVEALELPYVPRPPPGEMNGAPDPVWIGQLGALRITAGEGVPPDRIAPWYLRRAEAEVRRTGRAYEDRQNDV